MSKFRLAVFNTQPPHLYFGGVEKRIIETTKRLQNYTNVTVYSGTKKGFNKPTVLNGVNFVPCHSTDRIFPLDNWTFNRTLSKKAKTIKTDIYEAHAVSAYALLRSLKKQNIKKPFIHVVHGVLADEYLQAKQNGHQTLREKAANYLMGNLANLEAETARNATLIVTISDASLEKIKKHYLDTAEKVRIVPNGVDQNKFKPIEDDAAKTSTKKQFGLGSEPCVLFVGSLIPRKGLPYLIEAAQKIVKEHAQTKFLIVGNGPQKEMLVNNIAKLNLSNNFKFLGQLTEQKLSEVYACTDIFVLPSIQEGQGIVLLEAQASGNPVVAFDIEGVNETVINKETGLLVDFGSSDELAKAMSKLLNDRSLREKMGFAGRKMILENFTWDICASNMLKVYEEALANS